MNIGFFSQEMDNNGHIALSHAKFANHRWFDALSVNNADSSGSISLDRLGVWVNVEHHML